MSSEIKPLLISSHDNYRRVMYLAKELLNSNEKINLIASTISSPTVTRAAESLVPLGYVTFENIQTITEIHEGRRIKLIITLKKTANFKKLYDENEKLKNQRKEEREKEKEGKTKEK